MFSLDQLFSNSSHSFIHSHRKSMQTLKAHKDLGLYHINSTFSFHSYFLRSHSLKSHFQIFTLVHMSLLKYIDSDDDRFRYGFKIIFDFHSNFELKKKFKKLAKTIRLLRHFKCLQVSSRPLHFILFVNVTEHFSHICCLCMCSTCLNLKKLYTYIYLYMLVLLMWCTPVYLGFHLLRKNVINL